MVLITDLIKEFFSKERAEKRELNLSKEQKKNYSRQYWNIMIPGGLVIGVFVISLGESIILFLTRKEFLYLGLCMVFVMSIMNILKYTLKEVDLIEERITKREMKNLKQGIDKDD